MRFDVKAGDSLRPFEQVDFQQGLRVTHVLRPVRTFGFAWVLLRGASRSRSPGDVARGGSSWVQGTAEELFFKGEASYIDSK